MKAWEEKQNNYSNFSHSDKTDDIKKLITTSKQDEDGDQNQYWEGGKKLPPEITATFRMSAVAGEFVGSAHFQNFIILILFINGIMFGILTYDEYEYMRWHFELFNTLFLLLYSLDVVLLCVHHGTTFWRNAFLCSDIIIIIMSWIVDTGVTAASILEAVHYSNTVIENNVTVAPTDLIGSNSDSSSTALANGGDRSPQNILQAFQVMRIMLVLSRIGTLKELVQQILAETGNIAVICVFSLLLLYVFSILFTTLYITAEPGSDLYEFFGTLRNSAFTCVEIMTLEWSDSGRAIKDDENENSAGIWFMIFYIVIAHYIFFNLIIAVLCNAVTTKDELEGTLESKTVLRHKLKVAKKAIQQTEYKMKTIVTQKEQEVSLLGRLYDALDVIPDDDDNDNESYDDDYDDTDDDGYDIDTGYQQDKPNQGESIIERIIGEKQQQDREEKMRNQNTNDVNTINNNDESMSMDFSLLNSQEGKSLSYGEGIGFHSSGSLNTSTKVELQANIEHQQSMKEQDSLDNDDSDDDSFHTAQFIHGDDMSESVTSLIESINGDDIRNKARRLVADTASKESINGDDIRNKARLLVADMDAHDDINAMEVAAKAADKKKDDDWQKSCLMNDLSSHDESVTRSEYSELGTSAFNFHSDSHLTVHENNSQQSSQGDINSTKLKKAQKFIFDIINNNKIQAFIGFLLVANALSMGYEQTVVVQNSEPIQKLVEKVDIVFLVIFTVEVCMQLFGNGPVFFLDAFYVFDFFIIGISWLPYIPALESLPSFQIFRTFRTVRLLRALRYLSYFKALNDIILFISEVLPVIGHLLSFLVFLVGVFSVLFTELYGHMCLDEPYFKDLSNSAFTCMELMTVDEWSHIYRLVHKEDPLRALFIILFIFLSHFVIFNMLIALLANAVSVVDQLYNGVEARFELQKEVYVLSSKMQDLSDEYDELMESQEALRTLIKVEIMAQLKEKGFMDNKMSSRRLLEEAKSIKVNKQKKSFKSTVGRIGKRMSLFMPLGK